MAHLADVLRRHIRGRLLTLNFHHDLQNSNIHYEQYPK